MNFSAGLSISLNPLGVSYMPTMYPSYASISTMYCLCLCRNVSISAATLHILGMPSISLSLAIGGRFISP